MNETNKPGLLSPLALAYMGDAVFELLARARVVGQGACPVARMHRRTVELVNAGAQSQSVALLEPLLTDEELAIYKRGRNAHSGTTPKNADIADYRRATGLEALFGYLFLKGEQTRIQELFEAAMVQPET